MELQPWDRADLVRRVQLALELAGSALSEAVDDDPGAELPGQRQDQLERGPTSTDAQPLRLAKVVTEAAMLARCAASADDELTASVEHLARRLAPYAQGETVMAALCREPASALVHATGHIQLRDLGYDNAALDALLAEIEGGEDTGGPEQVPAQELEAGWLRRVWSGEWADGTVDDDVLRRSCAGRPLDVLTSSTSDLYAFTHVVLYATDMGRRPVALPRPALDTIADVEAGLAAAIDADNLDLAAELLWTWPMLRLPWTPAAVFAFRVLADAQDAAGYVPGPGFDPRQLERLGARSWDRYVLRTSYHATFVTGFLCAAMLRSGDRVPAPATDDGREPAVDAIASLLPARARAARWERAFAAMDDRSREALAPFVLSIALRRASASSDLWLIRQCLETAVRCGLAEGPAVRQSVALLRRATLLARTGITSAAGHPTTTSPSTDLVGAQSSGRQTV